MSEANHKNIVVVGAGIIGTSVATMLSKVSPNWHENNNAGTGHAALCELNYTVEQDDGSIDASKAQEINEQFELSRQFWGNLVKNGDISNPEEFIQPLPHISFVMGPTNVNFLR
ncbi:MAG: malate:quinone oxidoreductase, partial [Staphylococcus epidermidis]|nr:malate:quinone oxidoreductase [Staphylococcus epidermidis]